MISLNISNHAQPNELDSKKNKKNVTTKKNFSNIKITDLHIQKKTGFQAKFISSRKFP